VEWLGEVPVGWEIIRIKYCSRINMGQSPSSEDCNIEGIGLPFLQGNAEFNLINPIPNQYCEVARKVSQKGDLLISVRAPVGALNIANQDYGIGRGLCGITTNDHNFNSTFCWYLLHHVRVELNMNATGSTYDAVSAADVGNMVIVFPPLPEQRTIAAFLDRETGRIDALISHAVTKGLDPDVKMKDSGVEWLKEVPEHWGETITSALFMDNKKKNKGTKETNLLSLSYGNIIRKDINTNDGLLPDTFEAYQIVYPGYIVLRLTDLQNDKRSLRVGHVNENGIITSAYTGLRKKSDAVECSKYFYYLLHTYDIIKVFYGMGAGVRQSLNFNELRKLRLLLPPPEEQRAIATFLDRETGRIATLTAKIQESISKLREYRTALISAAVTGKIDVRSKET
jgi:type I restriction enzyme S subunit